MTMVARRMLAAAVFALLAAGAQAERSNDDFAQLEEIEHAAQVSVHMQQHSARSGADIELPEEDEPAKQEEDTPIKLASISSREEGSQVDQEGLQEVGSEEDEQGDHEASEDERVEVEGEEPEEHADGKQADAGEERPKVSELPAQELQAGEKMMELGAAAKAQAAVKSEAKGKTKAKAKTQAKANTQATSHTKAQTHAAAQARVHAAAGVGAKVAAQSGAQSGVQNNPSSEAVSTYDEDTHFKVVEDGAASVATATADFKTAVDATKDAADTVNAKYTDYDTALGTLGTELENADVAREKYFRDQYAYYKQEEATRNQPFTDYLAAQTVDTGKKDIFEAFFNTDGDYIGSGR